MSKVLLVDNFDSFTFNLYQFLGEIAESVVTVRNNQVPIDHLEAGEFTHVVISPGPGHPADEAYFGQCAEVIRKFHGRMPILGICLGHQGIGVVFGGEVVRANTIMHGKTSSINHSGQALFRGLPDNLTVMRYHSLVIEPDSLNPEFVVDATANDGSIMAIHHESKPTFGIQFHPESFATEEGKTILGNFLKEQ